ncbi:hypothetical protein E2C01_077791 [Portunus trituberculatus]|uniref:Uncharacterized protein n=1 Tax=Portunus trituberculatus TaxID=210409 RepID=A0A5B7IFD2_PORTR|nr:hypothetical protein [Portunus trituberculatus]
MSTIDITCRISPDYRSVLPQHAAKSPSSHNISWSDKAAMASSKFIEGLDEMREGGIDPQTDPAAILDSPFIILSSFIFLYYTPALPQHVAALLSFHISCSDTAAMVKFKFGEGLSEVQGGVDPSKDQPPSWISLLHPGRFQDYFT